MAVTFKDVQKLAEDKGIEVRSIPDFPAYCQLIMPSRSTPEWCHFIVREEEPMRMMPPLLLKTALGILKGTE
jgi:hypothetical protein